MGRNKVTLRLEGMKNVTKNLNKQLGRIKGKSMKGMIEAAKFIRRDMDSTPPLIPVGPTKKAKRAHVGTGTLRGSWSVSPRVPTPDSLTMGFSAEYATAVHFMFESKSGKPINWNRPNSGPLFFQSALDRNHKEILRIIALNARI